MSLHSPTFCSRVSDITSTSAGLQNCYSSPSAIDVRQVESSRIEVGQLQAKQFIGNVNLAPTRTTTIFRRRPRSCCQLSIKMCHITSIYHSCSHPDINYWTVRCATGLQIDPNCRKDSSTYPCEKTSSVWETPFQCTRCSRPAKRPCLDKINAEELYDEGMSLDRPEREECCDLALDDEEMERMDRELNELCSDEVSHASYKIMHKHRANVIVGCGRCGYYWRYHFSPFTQQFLQEKETDAKRPVV